MAEQLTPTARALNTWVRTQGQQPQFDPQSQYGPGFQSALNDILTKTQRPDVRLKLAMDLLNRGATDMNDPYAARAYAELERVAPGGAISAFMRGAASGLTGDPNLYGAAKYLGQGENRIQLPTEQGVGGYVGSLAGNILGFMGPVIASGGQSLPGQLAWRMGGKIGGRTALGLLAGEIGARSGLQNYMDTTAEVNAIRQGSKEAGWTGRDATPLTNWERLQEAATSGALNAFSVPMGTFGTGIARRLPGAAGKFFREGIDATFFDPRGKLWAGAQKTPGALAAGASNIPAAQRDYKLQSTERELEEKGGMIPLAALAPMLAFGYIGKPEASAIYAKSGPPTARFGQKGPSLWEKMRGEVTPVASHTRPPQQAGPQRTNLGPDPQELADMYLGEGQLPQRTISDPDLFAATQTRLAESLPTRQQLIEASIRKALLPETAQLQVDLGEGVTGKLLGDLSKAKALGSVVSEGQYLVETPTGVVQMHGNELLGKPRRGVLPTGQMVTLPPNMEPVLSDTGMGIRASVTMPEGQGMVTGVMYGHDPQTGAAVVLTDDGRVLRTPTSRVPEWQKFVVDAAAKREAAREAKLNQRKKGVAPKPRAAYPGFNAVEGRPRIQSMADRAKSNLDTWEGVQPVSSHDMSTGVTGPTAVPTRTPDADLDLIIQELLRTIRKPS